MAELNKITSFQTFSQLRAQENEAKLAEEKVAKRAELAGKLASILDEMDITSFDELELEAKREFITKAFGNVSEEAEEVEEETEEPDQEEQIEEIELAGLDLLRIDEKDLEFKIIKEEQEEGKQVFCVYNETETRSFGCYPTRELAESRLAQIHRFGESQYEDDLDLKDEIRKDVFDNVEQARDELEDLLQANRLYKFSYDTEQFIKKISGREADSYTIRETGKFISDLVNEIKLKYEVKE
mgnify:CR=1 FL=1